MRSRLLPLFLALAPLLSACPETAQDPRITLLSPKEGDVVCGEPLQVEVQVENFTLTEEEGGVYDEPDGTGHAHVYLNGQEVLQGGGESMEVPGPIADGAWQVKVDLANANHSPVEPYTSDTAVITVDAAACGP